MICATVRGHVRYTDKLVQVVPLKKRYQPDSGDIVVGRIVSVESKHWKVDINASQHAMLQLQAINIQGEQRRRDEEDKTRMREYFKENDLISAEVQSVNALHHSISLQTRNHKYGKLFNGFFVQVTHSLIKRQKNHILNFGCVEVILGNNGYVWI